MLRLPQIIQPCPPRPLNRTLHNLNTPHLGAVDLDPHLHADGQEAVAEQDGGVRAAAADVEADAGEGVAGREGCEEDVADAGDVGVGAGEEAGAGAGGVEGGDVGFVDGGDGEGVVVAGGGGWGVGFYFFGRGYGELGGQIGRG